MLCFIERVNYKGIRNGMVGNIRVRGGVDWFLLGVGGGKCGGQGGTRNQQERPINGAGGEGSV